MGAANTKSVWDPMEGAYVTLELPSGPSVYDVAWLQLRRDWGWEDEGEVAE